MSPTLDTRPAGSNPLTLAPTSTGGFSIQPATTSSLSPISATTPPPSTTVNASEVTNNPNIQTAPSSSDNQVTNPNAFIGSLNQFIGNTAGAPTDAEQSQSDLMQRQAQAYQQLGGEGQAQSNLESQLGVPQYLQQIQDLNTTIAQKTGQFQLAENNALHSGETTSFGQGAEALAQQQAGIELATLSSLQQAYQGNMTTALNYAQHAISLQYQPIQNQIDATQAQIQANAPLLSAEQQDRAETLSAALAVQSQAVQQAQTDKQNQFTIAHELAQMGAPTTLTSGIMNGTLSDALTAYSQFTNGGTPTGMSQSTIDNANGIIGGYNFGASSPLGAYAQNPNDINGMEAIYNTLPTNPTASSLQDVIDKVAPNSPITGAMLMSTAQQYGIPPNVLAARIQQDSSYSTAGAAAHTNNPGNVGTTSPSDEKSYSSLQEGLNAVAKNIKDRAAQPASENPNPQTAQNQTTNNTPTSAPQVELTNQQKIDAAIQAAPATLQPYIKGIAATGDMYIDGSQPGINATQARAYASAHGIQVVTGDTASDLNAISTALSNINLVDTKFNKISSDSAVSPSGFFSGVLSRITNPIGQAFNSKAGDERSAYNNTITAQAVRAFNAISNSNRLSSYIGSISTGELPTLSALTVKGDDTRSGMDKLNTLREQLNNALKSIFPETQGVPLTNAGDTTSTDTSGLNTTSQSILAKYGIQ